MTTVILTRHGETVWHAENRYAGRSDIDLSPRGLEQATVLARWARTAGLTAVWSSTLSRAERTAEATAEATGLPLRTDARFCEVDFGRGEGLTAAEMAKRFPAERAAFDEDPVASHMPEGEHPGEAAARFIEALREAAGTPGEGRVLIVAHSTITRLVLCHLLGLDLSQYRRVFPALGNCSLTELRLKGQGAALLSYNAPLISPASPPT